MTKTGSGPKRVGAARRGPRGKGKGGKAGSPKQRRLRANPETMDLFGSTTKGLSTKRTTSHVATSFESLEVYRNILDPPEQNVPCRNSMKETKERPGRHSRNLAGETGSMNSESKIALTSPTRSLRSPAGARASRSPKSPKSPGAAASGTFAFGDLDPTRKPQPRAPETMMMLQQPCRVAPPEYLKAPERVSSASGEQKGDAADRNMLKKREMFIRKKIADYAQIARACEREGRSRGEGHARFCMAVYYDNLNEYSSAITQYRKFLDISTQMNDVEGVSLANNSLGIAYQNIARTSDSVKAARALAKAAEYHAKHRDMADPIGKFVAYTNLGLVSGLMGDVVQATMNHEHALRCAIRLSDVARQSLALGHLGLVGSAHKDYVTARACMEKHLELVTKLGNAEGREKALFTLGEIAEKQGENKSAARFYKGALSSARENGNMQAADTAKVNIGIARGNLVIEDRMNAILSSLST